MISRTMLARVGPYSLDLGPRLDRRLFSCEDEDMYLAAHRCGCAGPISAAPSHLSSHPSRPFASGLLPSVVFLERRIKECSQSAPAVDGSSIAGVPRYVFGDALRGLWSCLRAILTRGPAQVRISVSFHSGTSQGSCTAGMSSARRIRRARADRATASRSGFETRRSGNDVLMAPASNDHASVVVSVVLCTFNRSHLVAQAIKALLHQRTGTLPYEVVVVDNNSTDATRQVVGEFRESAIVRYTFEPRQGLSVARNRGVAHARQHHRFYGR